MTIRDRKETERMVENIQKGMSFAVPFAKALVKIKEGVEREAPVALTIEENKAVFEAFRLLKDQRKDAP